MICKDCVHAISLKDHWDRPVYEYYRTFKNVIWCRRHRYVLNAIANRRCKDHE